MSVDSINCQELKQYLDDEKRFVLLDVREPEEFEVCQIDGSILTPLSEFEEHLLDFDPEKEYVVYCKLGKRGEKACSIMKANGFKNVRNLTGGIMSWATEIETHFEKY